MSTQRPDLLTLWILGGAVEEMRAETKKNIEALVSLGDSAEKLLARCLPFLRSIDAKPLRAEVVMLLEEVARSKPKPVAARDAKGGEHE